MLYVLKYLPYSVDMRFEKNSNIEIAIRYIYSWLAAAVDDD